MKTIKTWLATIAVLLCSITTNAHHFEVDGIYYNVTSSTDLTVAVTYRGSTGGEYTNEYSGDVIIPSSVTYNGKIYSVTSIGELAFFRCSITSINIPESVTSFGDSAWESCGNLTAIVVNSNNPVYDSRNNCNAIIETASNTLILGSASTIIPDGIMSIGNSAFSGNISLTSINIPESVTSIGTSAFSNCSSLTDIDIPESVTSIGSSAFEYCTSLTSITIPESVTNLDSRAFRGCKGELTVNCNIPDRSYAYSYEGPFSYSNFSKVIIGDNVTIIGMDAFSFSSTISTLIVGNNLTQISNRALPKVEKIFWMNSKLYSNDRGLINYTANSDYASYSNFKVYPMLSSMFEVDGVTYVPTSMSERTCDIVDYDCNRITTSENVNATVTYRNVEFTVNNVSDYAFYGNQHLEEVTLTNQGSVGAYAFANCSKLASVKIAEGVTSVGNSLFKGCNELESISVAGENTKLDSRNNCNAIIETGTNKLVAACNQTVIPESVTAIGDYAFSGCEEVTSINIHENISSIGDYAFSGCSSLADVAIEDRTEVLTLGSNGNKGLFADCPLESVYIGGKISYNTSSSKGYSPFSNNTTLRTVTITDKEETIYPYEFYNCSALKNLTIGDGVTSIGDYAFSGCSSLENFSFGCSMKTIGANAFLGCSTMKEISSSAVNPPICGANALNDADKWNCVLYMPVGYMAAYQAADQWKEFLLMEDIIPIKRYAMTYMVDDTIVYHVDSLAYEEAVVLPEAPTKEGYTFDGWVGVPETMPIHDVTANALFTINKYVLSYVVDGEVHMADSITYGDSIVVIAPIEREGHTFGGWMGVPERMPAKDTTIVGSFVVNSYLLTYTIDGDTIQSDSVAYGTEIIMLEAPVKAGYSFDGWDLTLSVMPAEDIVINGSYTRLPIENYIINDSDESFALEEDLQCNMITYIRNFKNTNWNALYVPFEIPLSTLAENYDIAYINDIHTWANEESGEIERMTMEVIKITDTDAVLNANHPYLIRPKDEKAKLMNLVVINTTLFAAEEVTLDCSSMYTKFEVTGSYRRRTVEELEESLVLGGGTWITMTEGTMNPFRLFLTISNREGSPVKINPEAAKSISIRARGENDSTTDIEYTEYVKNSEHIYDLLGRRILTPKKGELYIVNGKKVIY